MRALIWLLLPAALLGQTPQTTFRTTVRLIVQPVTVKDKQGKPVLGLTAKDFVVTEDGQPQEIAFVEYQALDTTPAPLLTVGPVPIPSVPATAATTVPTVTQEAVSVPIPGDVRYRGRRLVILYFDLYGMPFFDQFRAFANADKYVVGKMTAADLVAIIVFDGRAVRLRQDFTDDRVALRAAVQELVTAAEAKANGNDVGWDPGGAFGEDDDTFNLFATDRQLSALQSAVTDLAPLPELKTLVYFGSGLRAGVDNMAQLRATVNAAVRANVTLNPIDTRGLVATPPLGDATRASPGGTAMFSGTMVQAATTRFQQSQDALYALAKDTGGRALFDYNDLSIGIEKAADAVTGYYLIGYYTKNTATDGRFRRVKVSLGAGLSADLSYRPGYYGDKDYSKFNRADKERQLADALKLEDPITEIPMAMELNYFQLSKAEYFVPVSVRMPGSELMRPRPNGTAQVDIDMIGEIKDEYGVTHRNMRDRIAIPLDTAGTSRMASRPIDYETGFTVLPGNYTIKLLARDATTGRIGTFQRSFIVPNLERENTRLRISTVVLSSQQVASTDALFTVKQKISADTANPLVSDGQKLIPSVTRTFHQGRPLFVFLQAYEHDAATMHPLVAFVTFSREGAKVFETEPLTVSESWNPRSKAVPIRFTIPLSGLPPADYDCQVTVLDPMTGRAAFWRAQIVVIR